MASARGDASSSSPNVTEVCRRKVAALELALDGDSINAEAGEIPRALIDRVVLTPAPDELGGIDARLRGDLATVLALSDPEQQKLPAMSAGGSQLSLVAGERNHRQLTLPPVAV